MLLNSVTLKMQAEAMVLFYPENNRLNILHIFYKIRRYGKK